MRRRLLHEDDRQGETLPFRHDTWWEGCFFLNTAAVKHWASLLSHVKGCIKNKR